MGSAKLTESQVLAARAAHAAGATVTELKRTYGVAYDTMKAVVTRRTWTHI